MKRSTFFKAIGLLLLSGCRVSDPAKFRSGKQSERIDKFTRDLSGEPPNVLVTNQEDPQMNGIYKVMTEDELIWLERKVKREGLR